MSIQRRALLAAAATGAATAAAGCLAGPGRGRPARDLLTLAATTSTDDAGIIDHLNAAFEATVDARVRAIPRGSGAALRLVATGDADVAVSHAPALERARLDAGDAVDRRELMWNRFTVVGPPDDPAGVADRDRLPAAFEALAAAEAPFLSRGDASGTFQREREVWAELAIVPDWDGYQAIGQGMAGTLIQADQRGTYTLTDEATHRSMRARLGLERHLHAADPGPLEINRYSVLAANPARHETVDHALATAYIDFVGGAAGQAAIGSFTVDGRPLFEPVARLPDGEGDGA